MITQTGGTKKTDGTSLQKHAFIVIVESSVNFKRNIRKRFSEWKYTVIKDILPSNQ